MKLYCTHEAEHDLNHCVKVSVTTTTTTTNNNNSNNTITTTTIVTSVLLLLSDNHNNNCNLTSRYEKKLEQMQELWRGRPLFEIFDGWEIPRDKVVINRKLGEGAFGTVYGGECLFDSQGWVSISLLTSKAGEW